MRNFSPWKRWFFRKLIRILLFGFGLIRNVRRNFVMELLKINYTFPTYFVERLKAHSKRSLRSSIKIVRPTCSIDLYQLLQSRAQKKKKEMHRFICRCLICSSHIHRLLCHRLQFEKCDQRYNSISFSRYLGFN